MGSQSGIYNRKVPIHSQLPVKTSREEQTRRGTSKQKEKLMGHFWDIFAGTSWETSRICAVWQFAVLMNIFPKQASGIFFLICSHLASLAQPASKRSHFLKKLICYSELSGVVPSLILTSSCLDYATLVTGKSRGFPSTGIWLSADPRNNSDVLLLFDGSWERNWLHSSRNWLQPIGLQRWKETVALAVCLMTTGINTFLTVLQVKCCTLDLKQTYGGWPWDAALEPRLSSPLFKFSPLCSHPSHCKYSSLLFLLPLLWLNESLKIQDNQRNATLCLTQIVKWMI